LVAFDFDGVFTDNMVYVFQDGTEAVRCFRSDGLGLQRLKQVGIEAIIISTEKNQVVQKRSDKLKLRCFYAVEDKLSLLGDIINKRKLSMQQVAFIGNDINDLSCLSQVGLPIVVRDAHPDILLYAIYKTKRLGGHGAVREVCDLISDVISPTIR
jgi:3-deoxy-D-manno-octulosonate 8-phosphate phosphatase (KDO 8-P phosphatase)